MRIAEQALREIPPGLSRFTRDRHAYSAAEMVDLARWATSTRFEMIPPSRVHLGVPAAMSLFIATGEKRVPPAQRGYLRDIEGLMQHFKLVMHGHGVRPPKGEVYFPVEGANGELGFYVVSDGSGNPYRVRVRPPCFAIMSALKKLIIGDMIADLTPTFGSVNMIGGELDR